MDLFDIIGPVMIGPSSSHTAGAARIGLVARRLLGQEPVRCEIRLHGSFAETSRGHGTDRALAAGLLGMQVDDPRLRDSLKIAREQGLEVTFQKVEIPDAHPNTAVLEVERADGKVLTLQAASTGGGRIRVDKLNGVEVSFTGMFNTLVIRHKDIAGELADVTRELSNGRINIASMSLCRDRRGGDALTVIETDQRVPPVVRQLIGELPGVEGLTYYEKEED